MYIGPATRILRPARSSGALMGRTLLVTSRKPFSPQASTWMPWEAITSSIPRARLAGGGRVHGGVVGVEVGQREGGHLGGQGRDVDRRGQHQVDGAAPGHLGLLHLVAARELGHGEDPHLHRAVGLLLEKLVEALGAAVPGGGVAGVVRQAQRLGRDAPRQRHQDGGGRDGGPADAVELHGRLLPSGGRDAVPPPSFRRSPYATVGALQSRGRRPAPRRRDPVAALDPPSP